MKNRILPAVLFAGPALIALFGFQFEEAANQLVYLSNFIGAKAQEFPLTFGLVWVLIFGIILALGYLAFQYLVEPTGTRDAKMTKYYSNRNDAGYRTDVNELTFKAKTIDVIGIGNSQFTSHASLEFYKSLLCDSRTTVRLLFLDPKGEQVTVREHDEEHAPSTLSTQVYKHMSYIKGFMAELENEDPVARALLQYRFYDRYPSCNMIIFDRETVLVQHYLYSTRGAISPIFRITGKDAWMVKFYLSEFDQLWNASRVPTPDELVGSSVVQ